MPDGATFDSLLVGFYTKDGRFRYAGRVREGFTARTRAALTRRLRLHGLRDQCPFDDLPHVVSRHTQHPWDQHATAHDMPGFRWLPSAEVIEVAYLGWARHGLLRQGRFLGIREDKYPYQVTG